MKGALVGMIKAQVVGVRGNKIAGRTEMMANVNSRTLAVEGSQAYYTQLLKHKPIITGVAMR